MKRQVIIIAALLAFGAAWADMEWQTAIGQKDQVTKGLVAYWAMRSSGTTVYDEWTGGYNVSAAGSPTFGETYAAVGNGVLFDGLNDYLERNDTSALDFGTADSFSISMWFYLPTMPASQQSLISKRAGSNGAGWGFVFRNDTYKLEAWVEGINGVAKELVNVLPFTNGVWSHIVFQRDVAADTIAFYRNGAAETSTVDTTTATLANSWKMQIGAQRDGATNAAKFFSGQIDETRIYNRALTADEVKQLYRMGAIPKGIK
jgi:hypothetical protein